jgi:hypothetical protein
MNAKRLAGAAAIATAIELSASTFGIGFVNAAPSDPPPPCPTCQSDSGGPGAAPAPPESPNNPAIVDPANPSQINPPVGGGATSGGRAVEQPH